MPDLPTEERICPSKNGEERKSRGAEKQEIPKLMGISCVPLIRGMNHSPLLRKKIGRASVISPVEEVSLFNDSMMPTFKV